MTISDRCPNCLHAAHGPGRCLTPSLYGCRVDDCAFVPTFDEIAQAWCEAKWGNPDDDDLLDSAREDVCRFVESVGGRIDD